MLTNSLTLEYPYRQANQWTITKLQLVQVWPRRRIARSELPKLLAFELAEKLIRIESFRVAHDAWLEDGNRVIFLTQSHEAILAQQQAEKEAQREAEIEALHQEHLRKLELSRQIKAEKATIGSMYMQRLPVLYGNRNRVPVNQHYEAALDDIMNYHDDQFWAERLYNLCP